MSHPASRILTRTGAKATGTPVAACPEDILKQHKAFLLNQLTLVNRCQLEGRPVSIGDVKFADPVKALTELHKALASVNELIANECGASIHMVDFRQWEDDQCCDYLHDCYGYDDQHHHGRYRHYE